MRSCRRNAVPASVCRRQQPRLWGWIRPGTQTARSIPHCSAFPRFRFPCCTMRACRSVCRSPVSSTAMPGRSPSPLRSRRCSSVSTRAEADERTTACSSTALTRYRDGAKKNPRSYRDLHEHVLALAEAGLLVVIDEPINKDTEMPPLVRWQYRGGVPEPQRKAFLFTQPTDSKGRRFDAAVLVAGLAANRDVYRIGFGKPLEEIGSAWINAIANPI